MAAKGVRRSDSDSHSLEDWKVLRKIGTGTTGSVYEVRNRRNNTLAAMKVVSGRTEGMSSADWEKLRIRTEREAHILMLLDHPNIVKMYESYEHEGNWHLIMELVTGGELLDMVQDNPEGRLPEAKARKWFRQIVDAVDYCHAHLVIHRDLKLENVLIDKNNNVKITDFGFANFIQDYDTQLKTFCGSPMYAAPEIFIGVQYRGPPLDVWSMGVLLFTMTCGSFPWKSKTADYNLMREVINARFTLPEHLSDDIQDLIMSMLKVDPRERCTLEDVIGHKWMVGDPKLPKLNSHSLSQLHDTESINQVVLEELIELGFERGEVVAELLKGNTNPAAAAYNLLLARQARGEGPVVPKASSRRKDGKSRKKKSTKEGSSKSSTKEGSSRRRKKSRAKVAKD